MNKHNKDDEQKSNLFETEENLYRHGKGILKDKEFENNPLLPEFETLLKGYKKNFSSLKQIIKFSDKQQYNLVLELKEAFESFIRTLVTTIEAKHESTAGHTQRVTNYALFLGEKFNLSSQEMEVLKYAALLHDIGKIGIPDAILTKNGRFSHYERAVINKHPLWTFKIIKSMKLPRNLKEVPKIAASHHEKLDGTGYPHGLKGKDIPFLTRILAVCDVLDALTSFRDYPKYDKDVNLTIDPIPLENALSILVEDKDKHFDHHVVMKIIEHKQEFDQLFLQNHEEG